MVDLPAFDGPVNQRQAGTCNFWLARTDLSTLKACQWTLAARRSEEANLPRLRNEQLSTE